MITDLQNSDLNPMEMIRSELRKLNVLDSVSDDDLKKLGELIVYSAITLLAKEKGVSLAEIQNKSDKTFFENFSDQEIQTALMSEAKNQTEKYLSIIEKNKNNTSTL